MGYLSPATMTIVPWRGSRWCRASLDNWFQPSRRAIGATVDASWCGWVYIRATPAVTNGIWRAHTTSSTIGWSLYMPADRSLRLYWGTGGDVGTAVSSAGAVALNQWHFIVVNLDRDGNGIVYLNGTAAVTADISAAAAVNWASGLDVWLLGSSASTAVELDMSVAGVGFLVGQLLSEDNRTELYNGGRLLRYSQFSAGLATVFADQDYWELRERSGNGINAITAARPLVGKSGNDNYTAISSWKTPRR